MPQDANWAFGIRNVDASSCVETLRKKADAYNAATNDILNQGPFRGTMVTANTNADATTDADTTNTAPATKCRPPAMRLDVTLIYVAVSVLGRRPIRGLTNPPLKSR